MSQPASSRGEFGIAWRQFLARRVNRIALGVVLVLVAVAMLADFVAAERPLLLYFHGELYWLPNLSSPPALRIYDNQVLQTVMGRRDWAIVPLVPWGHNSHDLAAVLAAPSSSHWLGTDASGRDILARIIHGTRISLFVGAMSVAIMVAVGVTLGTLAGYLGNAVDTVLMRVVEIVHSIPTILLLVTILAVVAPQGFAAVWVMTLVIGLVRWTDIARLARGEVLRIRALEYVDAARAEGAGDLRVLFRHVLPNAKDPILVSATFGLASSILLEGALSFLGFGIPDDMASWGGLLSGVRGNVQAWWLALFPGAAVFLSVTAVNVVGEGVRDATDPRLRA
jgi:peptide/nickel transport system permease protein